MTSRHLWCNRQLDNGVVIATWRAFDGTNHWLKEKENFHLTSLSLSLSPSKTSHLKVKAFSSSKWSKCKVTSERSVIVTNLDVWFTLTELSLNLLLFSRAKFVSKFILDASLHAHFSLSSCPIYCSICHWGNFHWSLICSMEGILLFMVIFNGAFVFIYFPFKYSAMIY